MSVRNSIHNSIQFTNILNPSRFSLSSLCSSSTILGLPLLLLLLLLFSPLPAGAQEDAAEENSSEEEEEQAQSLREEREQTLSYGIDSQVLKLVAELEEEENTRYNDTLAD
ncbi:MAG: hypothetical protein R6V67_02520, partial [Spirochaetia bacterium]